MPNHQNLSQLFETYILECRYSRQLRPQTIKGYKEVFATFCKIMEEVNEPTDISIHSLNMFFERLGTRKRTVGKQEVCTGIKASTVKTYYRKLIAFFRWMERYGYLQEGLCERISKPPEPRYTDDRALTATNISKLIATISLHTMHDILVYQRDMLILCFCIYAGLRRSELLGLRIQDIDLDKRIIKVNAETSKGKKSRRIPLHPQLFMLLEAFLKERRKRKIKCEYVIISTREDMPYTIHGLKHWVERYRELSGIRFHIHQTRHTFACTLAKSGVDTRNIMKALGHSSLRMTETYLRSITTEISTEDIHKLSY